MNSTPISLPVSLGLLLSTACAPLPDSGGDELSSQSDTGSETGADGSTDTGSESAGEGGSTTPGDTDTSGDDGGDAGDGGDTDTGDSETRRVPAEWELQAAVWLQWPQVWEAHFEPAFVEIVRHASSHQAVHLLAHSDQIRNTGMQALSAGGVSSDQITWHVIPNDNAWMRDNGPRYVLVDGELVIQNWGFDAWGGNFGPGIPYAADDAVPQAMAELLDMPLEQVDLIHERGDLEFNGEDTVVVSWSVLSDRNPGVSKDDITATLQAAFGVDSVVYIEGFHPEDGTTGHVDGFTRFISADEIIVGQIDNPSDDPLIAGLFDDVAEQIAEQRPDLTLTRMPFPAEYDYMNWLVGNDYVISGAFGDAQADADAKARIEGYFPGRTVYMVDVTAMWADGGGIHCVTNDQPL